MMLVFNVEPNPKHIFIWSWSVCVRVGRLASFIKHMTICTGPVAPPLSMLLESCIQKHGLYYAILTATDDSDSYASVYYYLAFDHCD